MRVLVDENNIDLGWVVVIVFWLIIYFGSCGYRLFGNIFIENVI